MKAEQQAFVDAVLGRSEPPSRLRKPARGLAVYRNNAQALSAQALAVAFERLHAELGDTAFAALAWTYWRHEPPSDGDLGQWGAGLSGFLVARAGEASGLPDLARLDWAVHEAERAADAVLDAESLQRLSDTPADALWLTLRPALRLLHQSGGAVLVWRAGWRGAWRSIAAPEAAFFAAVLDGACLAEALTAAQARGSGVSADFDFGTWLQAALQNAWLQGVRTTPPNPKPTP
jgi:hypothetical protein